MADERGRGAAAGRSGAPTPVTIKWDDSNMKSSYANVCNVASTRHSIELRPAARTWPSKSLYRAWFACPSR